MIRYLFGEPEFVSCRAGDKQSKFDTVHSNFYYNGTPVTAIGDWSLDGVKFRHGYRVGFEQATVIFDSNVVTIYQSDGQSHVVDLKYSVDGIEGEIEYFANCICNNTENDKNAPESAAMSIKIAELLK